MSEVTVLQTPEQRLTAVAKAMDDANKLLPPGVPPALFTPLHDLAARVDAIAGILIGSGTVTDDEFCDRVRVRKAELGEQLLENLREMKRQALGLQVPQMRPPQGVL